MPRAPCWSPAPAAVAGADVEVPVGTEQQQPAVVVALVVGHPQHDPGRAGVGAVGARAPVLDHALVARVVGEVDVEAAGVGVVGREGDRQQALLAAGGDLAADVEERALAPAADDHDAPGLLDHEHAPAVGGRRGHVDRGLEAPDRLQARAAAGGGGRGGRRGGLGRRGRRGRRRRRRCARVIASRSTRGHEHSRGQRDQSHSPHAPTGWQDAFQGPVSNRSRAERTGAGMSRGRRSSRSTKTCTNQPSAAGSGRSSRNSPIS